MQSRNLFLLVPLANGIGVSAKSTIVSMKIYPLCAIPTESHFEKLPSKMFEHYVGKGSPCRFEATWKLYSHFGVIPEW